MTSPIVKWVGGKTKLLPEIVKRLPARYRMYYEPFFGGGALFFHQRPKFAIINDMNPDLVLLYKALQVDVDKVIRTLSQMQRHHNTGYYERIRRDWNLPSKVKMSDARRAATFIYLNKTCFNGLWRVNSSGEFNVPMGDHKIGKTICDTAKLRSAAIALRTTTIRFGDYWNSCSHAMDGDFVYFDPPYDPVSASSSFTGYTSGGFDRSAQNLLADRARRLVMQGVQVMLSNSDTAFIRKLYREREFKISKVMAPRAINSNGKRRGKVGELIITGGY